MGYTIPPFFTGSWLNSSVAFGDKLNTRYNRRTTMEIQRYTAADLPTLFDKITPRTV